MENETFEQWCDRVMAEFVSRGQLLEWNTISQLDEGRWLLANFELGSTPQYVADMVQLAKTIKRRKPPEAP
ncbi:MAG: hypothetical protein RLP02_12920 [Coleofasciculus sp. C2-GNP5-27]|jgi:hypothetical protein|uniref:hypothetical protein n=1 Tax=Coleofasciculus sp. C1-SOL-03 TaxID=3069522 RepID=UPI0032F5C279